MATNFRDTVFARLETQNVARLLALSGDVESNPGPCRRRVSVSHREFIEEELDDVALFKALNGCSQVSRKTIRMLLLLGGDIETNPGPVMSKMFPLARYNCLSASAELNSGLEQSLSEDGDNAPRMCRVCGKLDRECKCWKLLLQSAGPLLSFATGIMRLVRELSRAHAQVGFGLFSSTTECMNAVGGMAGSAQDTLDKLQEAIASIPGMVQDALNSNCGFLPVSIRTVLIMAATMCGVYVIYRLIGLSAALFDTCLRVISTICSIPSFMIDLFREWVEWTARPIAQAGEGGDDPIAFLTTWVPILVPMFFSLVTTGILGKLPCKELTPDLWMNRVANFPRACRGLGDIFSYIKSWFEYAVKYVEKCVWGIENTDGTYPEIESWMTEVLNASRDMKTACDTQGKCERVSSLWIVGSGLLRKYSQSLPREVADAVKRTLVLASKLGDQARNLYMRPDGVRMVPQMLWLVGESQIGKTTLTYYIAAELLSCFGMAHLVAEHVYTRCSENEYFDGYNGQYITVYDDWGQKKDSPNNPSVEFFEIIRAISNFPYPLHMADISQKTGSFFSSKAIICSTNDRCLRIESLTYPDAVWNRATFAFEVRIKEEYQQRLVVDGKHICTLDKAKAYDRAPTIDGKKQLVNLDVYEFYRFDARDRRRPNYSGPYTFREMTDMLKADMRTRMARGEDLTVNIKQYADMLTAGRDTSIFFPQRVEGHAQVGDEFHDATDTPRAWDNLTVEEINKWCEDTIATDDFHNDSYLLALVYRNELIGKPGNTTLVELDESEFLYSFAELYEKMKATKVTKPTVLERMAESVELLWKTTKIRLAEVAGKVLHPLWISFKSTLKTMLIDHPLRVVAVATAFVGFGYLYKRQTDSGTHTTAESHNPTTQPKYRQLRTYKQGRVRRVGRAEGSKPVLPVLEAGALHADAQVAADNMQWDMICSVYKQQYLIIPVVGGMERESLGVLTMIKGSIAMMPYHFKIYLDMMKPDKVRLKNLYLTTGKEMEFTEFITENNCVVIERDLINGERTYSDICYLDLTTKMPPAKDITKYFVRSADLDRLVGKIPVALSGPRPSGETIALMCSTGHATPRDSVRYDISRPSGSTGENPTLVARDLYEYDIPTQPGYCGQLLSVTSSLLAQKFLGMHVAGSRAGRNWSCLVTFDDMKQVMEVFAPVAQMSQNFSDRPACVKVVPGEFLPVCQIDDGPVEIAKSAIIPSSMHGRLTVPTTIPAKLRPFEYDGERRDPLALGVVKAGRCTPTCDSTLLRIAGNDVYRNFMEGITEPLRVLSIEEAIAGVPGDDLRNPISTVTSPGYGWDRHGMKGKTYYLGQEGFDPLSPGYEELVAACEKLVSDIRAGNTLDLLSLDCLKDERRPKEKVLTGKTRVFTVLPMHLNVVIRQYFMDGIVAIRKNRIRNGTAVGINVWSEEWEYMYKYLNEVSFENAGDGDFGNLDGTLMDKILWELFDILDRMYDDDNTDVRKALWIQLVYCVRYYRGSAYQCTHSLPSGIFGTSDFGSGYLLIAFRYIWLRLAPLKFKTMQAFNAHVRLVTYGDDNIWTVSNVAREFWTMQALTDEFTLLGMQYTDAAKTGTVAGFKTLHEVQFLKRFWKWSNVLQRHTCPAELLGRLETLNWTRKNSVVDPRTIESDVVQDVLQEIAAHGKEVFDEWAPRVVRCAITSGVPNVHLEDYLHYHMPREVSKRFLGSSS